MSQEIKVKIVMIGPSGCGKSRIANVISDAIDSEAFGEPRPTRGVRILEFQPENTESGNSRAEVELWDCSGDSRHETCWPMMRKGVQGVILIYSAKVPGSQKHLNMMYNYFVTQSKLSPKQCVIFHTSNDDGKVSSLGSNFAKISQVGVNLTSGNNRLKIDFSNFISSVLKCIRNSEIYE